MPDGEPGDGAGTGAGPGADEPEGPAWEQRAAASALDAALARVGDRWALLLVHTLLGGPARFNDLLARLPGIAPNVLSSRLKQLEREGVALAQPYSRRPPRFAYQLTDAGAELAGALRLLARWGAVQAGQPDALTHQPCGTALETRWYCPTCDRLDEGDELYFL